MPPSSYHESASCTSCRNSAIEFTHLAWENIDRLEETITGKVASHRVNGIAVQSKVYGSHLPKANLPIIEKHRHRTVSTEHQELDVYVAGERVGPQQLITIATGAQETKESAQVARYKNMIRVLARQTNTEDQTIPSCTGFNIRKRILLTLSEAVIGYLTAMHQRRS